MPNAELPIEVRQFLYAAGARDEHIFSYLVCDIATREAVLIDGQPELAQDYSDFLARNHFKEARKISTVGGAAEEQIVLGSTRLKIIQTPGITPHAICLTGAGMIFTGGTLWTGTKVPPLGVNSDVETLFKTLAGLKERLSPETLVFPGFDAEDRSFSVWSVELEKNPDLKAGSLAALNQSKTRDWDPDRPSFAQISADKLAHKFPLKKSLLIDVREPDEFANGHIPGAKNVMLSELPFRLEELRRVPRIYVCGQSGQRSQRVATTLSYLGLNDVVVLTGGIQAWQNAGFDLEK